MLWIGFLEEVGFERFCRVWNAAHSLVPWNMKKVIKVKKCFCV